ncbi:unnamed protein product, partial [marine sediment metagenome]
GPYVYVKDGKLVRDNSADRGGSHGPQHEFVVEALQPEHPILNGLPSKWLHVKDELYSELRESAKNMEILATAYADKEFKGTDEWDYQEAPYNSGMMEKHRENLNMLRRKSEEWARMRIIQEAEQILKDNKHTQ